MRSALRKRSSEEPYPRIRCDAGIEARRVPFAEFADPGEAAAAASVAHQDSSLHSHEAADVSAPWFGIEIAFPRDVRQLALRRSEALEVENARIR
jgi:hypothetical protein